MCRPAADNHEAPRNKERETRVQDRAKNGANKIALSFFALVSFLARPKTQIPLLGLSLFRNQTETLAMQANNLLSTCRAFDFYWVGRVP